jgi:hypothetical protein
MKSVPIRKTWEKSNCLLKNGLFFTMGQPLQKAAHEIFWKSFKYNLWLIPFNIKAQYWTNFVVLKEPLNSMP